MSDKSLKVTDRRMFTPDGELREEFSHLREVPAEAAPQAPAGEREAGADLEPAVPEPAGPPPSGPPPAAAVPPEDPAAGEGRRPAAPGFFDLVGLLAEPATHYMREARSAPPQAASQSLALARLHIDLLAVLKDKTEGNLAPEEKAMLDDVVYQLRSGFVGLGG